MQDNLFPCVLPPQRVKGSMASCSLGLLFMDLSQPGFTFLIIPFQPYGKDQIILGSLVASNANLKKGKSNQIFPETVRFIPFAGNKGLLMFEDCLEKQSYLMELICHGSYYVLGVVDKEIKKQILQVEAIERKPFFCQMGRRVFVFLVLEKESTYGKGITCFFISPVRVLCISLILSSPVCSRTVF